MPNFEYSVDEEKQETTEHELTPATILKNAGIDPATHYLMQIEGNHRISYQDQPDTVIHMHQHMRFISISTAPTPES